MARYRVSGRSAQFGQDVLLGLTKEQVSAREHLLVKEGEGYRPKVPMDFKQGEEIVVLEGDVDKRALEDLEEIEKNAKAKQAAPAPASGKA